MRIILGSHKWTVALLSLAVTSGASSLARAQDAVVVAAPPAETHSETVTQKGGPSRIMLASGLVTFGVTYGAGAIVAATSPVSADQRMFVPLVGPWMDVFDRPGCGNSCDMETTYKVLIVFDGIGQAIGALTIIDAFLNPEVHTETRTVTALSTPTIHVSPASLGAGGYGMLAAGTF